MNRVILLLVGLLIGSACTSSVEGPTEASAGIVSVEMGVLERHVLEMINNHRMSVGCTALGWDGTLGGVALSYSQDMHSRNFFAHVDPDGLGLLERLKRAGIQFQLAGENLAQGYSRPEEANALVSAWLQSSEHRRNIETCHYTRTGLGLYNGYWTHVFAA